MPRNIFACALFLGLVALCACSSDNPPSPPEIDAAVDRYQKVWDEEFNSFFKEVKGPKAPEILIRNTRAARNAKLAKYIAGDRVLAAGARCMTKQLARTTGKASPTFDQINWMAPAVHAAFQEALNDMKKPPEAAPACVWSKN